MFVNVTFENRRTHKQHNLGVRIQGKVFSPNGVQWQYFDLIIIVTRIYLNILIIIISNLLTNGYLLCLRNGGILFGSCYLYILLKDTRYGIKRTGGRTDII